MKNKGIALAACIALAAPNIAAAEIFTGIAAMNLGDINSPSYLDERFSASIPILYTSAAEALGFKARLAPDDVFDDLGVERLAILKSLQFKVKIRNGEPYVAIQSSKAIDLPFLSFVVEVYSSEGSIYQDYTVLLDPRHFSAKNTSTNVKRGANVVSHVKASVATPLSTVKTTRPKTLRVKAGDTLSSIANTVKLDKISNKKMSLALFLKNPRAFSGNNVNKLKKGVTLKIPSFTEVIELVEKKPLPAKPLTNVTKIASSKPLVKKDVTKAVIKNPESLTSSYIVKSGDSLSAIARQYASKSISLSTMMTVIHSANPHAFTNNKVNLLKKGVTLSIPLNAESKKASGVMNNTKTEQSNIPLITKSEHLETAINLSLNSLEKRLREIRKSLKSTKSELFDLKLTLKNKNMLLDRQSKDIQILKKKLLKVQSTTKSTLVTEEGSVLATPSKQKIVDNNNSDNQTSVSEIVTYSGVALLMGLVLLRVGRQKYAERMVASNDYIATANIDPQLPIDELDFTKTLTEAAKASDRKITDLSIQEAERLVEELVDELGDQTPTIHYDKASIINDNIEEKVDSSLDSWAMESTPQKSHSDEETTDLRIDIIDSLEKTMEKRVQPKKTIVTEPLQQRDEHTSLEIDLERHLQSINDQIIANKMKDLV